MVATLEEAKSRSIVIKQGLEVAIRTKTEIEQERLSYIKAAERGSVLYFSINSLAAINNM